MQAALDTLKAHELYVQGKAGGCRAFFRYQSLSGLSVLRRQIDEVEFIGCDLRHTQFALSSLKCASFYCSNLMKSDLRGTDLRRSDFRGAIVRSADFYRAHLEDADFRKAVLFKDERYQDLSDCDWLPDDPSDEAGGIVDFRDASMVRANLSAAKLKGADFSGAILENAVLERADLRGANFRNAIVTGSDFKGARLEGAVLEDMLKAPNEAALARCEFIEAAIAASDMYTRTKGEHGQRANLEGEDLRVLEHGCAGKGLIGANLRGVCAAGVDFSGASLLGAVFEGADLRGAKFDRAVLRGVSFQNCNLNHASFDGADLRAFRNAEGRTYAPVFADALFDATQFGQALFDPEFSLAG